MTTDRLKELRRVIEVPMIGHLSPEEQKDLISLINAEIRKIESRRKVPLMPCRCGSKRASRWYGGAGIFYECDKCAMAGDVCNTDKEARIAWNEVQKGGET